MNCVVSGTFDPITVGHVDIIKRAAKMFDKVYVLVAKSSSKANSVLAYEDKVEIIKKALIVEDPPRKELFVKYEILPIENTLIDTMNSINVNVIVRGLRNGTDLIYEMDMSSVNRDLNPEIETVYLPCMPELSYVSSSMVRELCRLGKYSDASKYCGEFAANKIHRKSIKLIGLTGGIACGKSEVQKIFEKNGWYGIDLDKVSEKVLFDNAADLIEMINATNVGFGRFSLTDTRKEFKSKLAKLIFSNKYVKEKVEGFMHPLIIEEMWKEIYSSSATKVIVQAPLLYEAKMENLFDSVVCVYSSRTLQILRLNANRGMTVEDANTRIDSQMDINQKMSRSKYCIENANDDISVLEYKVNLILKKL